MLFQPGDKALELPDRESAIADREQSVQFTPQHFVSGNRLLEPLPANLQRGVFGLGCFWGAERLFWTLPGVYSTAVGYAGGITANPNYEEVCSGMTGHSEVVLVFYDPSQISFHKLLVVFWESHDPTQGMRQGNDQGSQYRSAIYTTSEQQLSEAVASAKAFQTVLRGNAYPSITTEIKELAKFYYAEDYHQQYLAKNPGGYCNIAGTGACYPADAA